MRLTKLEMAKVIVQQLYLLEDLPSDDHWHVVKLARLKIKYLKPQYELAVDAANSRIRAECSV